MLKRTLLAFVLLDFAAFTAYVAFTEGPLGFVPTHASSGWAVQVFLDLCIAATFGGAWLWRDAKERGVNPLPWVLAIPLTGSLALLAYVVLRPHGARAEQGPEGAPQLAR